MKLKWGLIIATVFLSGCLVAPTPTSKPTSWTVDDEGNTHFTVTSNGFTCEEWIRYLHHRGWIMGGEAYQILPSASEAPTNGVTYNIVVQSGDSVPNFTGISLTTKDIRAVANKKGWLKPHWEVACLIRDKFTDEQLKQMDLQYIVTMHEPIKDDNGHPYLLLLGYIGHGRWLNADVAWPDGYWDFNGGFAFVVPQVNTQT